MFSVIIPLYNKSSYISKAVESVLNQTFTNFELIIVDDGSTDESASRVKSFSDSRISLISQPNRGVSSARNTGLQVAKFDHVAFLDADDWWDRDFLSEMSKLISDYNEAGIYGSSYYTVKKNKLTQAKIGIEDGFNSGYINYFRAYSNTFWSPINSSCVVVNKRKLEGVGGFKENLKFGEDFDLWMRIAINHKVGFLNKPLSYYNQDVEIEGRALGMDKYWKPSEHFIFNLDNYYIYENNNSDLKELLDGLRIRNLTSFYINSWHNKEVNKILDKVAINKRPNFYKYLYATPPSIAKAYFELQYIGSTIKGKLITKFKAIK